MTILTKEEVFTIAKSGVTNWSVVDFGNIMYSLMYYIEKNEEFDTCLTEMCEGCVYEKKGM